MKSESKFGVLGFLAGAAMGAAIGILLAPKAGKETRSDIKKSAKKAQKKMSEMVDKVRQSTSATVTDLVDGAGAELKDKAKKAADSVRQSAN